MREILKIETEICCNTGETRRRRRKWNPTLQTEHQLSMSNNHLANANLL